MRMQAMCCDSHAMPSSGIAMHAACRERTHVLWCAELSDVMLSALVAMAKSFMAGIASGTPL